MSEADKNSMERLLDLLVYAPAGLALTAAEEFPRLVEKGRHRVEGQLHAARLVGQFAVQMGRRQLEDTVGSLVHRGPAEPPSDADTAGSVPTAGAGATSGTPDDTPPPSAPAAAPAPAAGVTTASSPNGTMGSDALGIPGYDSLSASQVVQRLGGLSQPELEAVRAHELAHRHRRTILHRVEQLLAGTEPG